MAGTQKVVSDHAAVLDRTEKYCLAVESARVRDAYKIPGSAINYQVSLKSHSPFAPQPRVVVVLVKEPLGY